MAFAAYRVVPFCLGAALSHPPASYTSLQTLFSLQSGYSTESEPCISAFLISQGSTQRACFHEMQRLQSLIRHAWFMRGRGKGIEASLHAHDLHPSVIRVKGSASKLCSDGWQPVSDR